MAMIEANSEALQKTIDALDGQIKALQGITSGRQPSNAEARTLQTLQDERAATAKLFEQACKAEDEEFRAERKAAYSTFTPDRIAQMNKALRGLYTGDPKRDAIAEAVARGDSQRGLPAGHEVSDPAVADFRAYIRSGETRASLSYTDANGGYAVPNPVVSDIVDKLKAQDPILGRARVFNMEGTNDLLEIPVVDALGATAWTTETGARSEQNAPELTQVQLQCYEVYSDWRATQRFIDSVPGIEEWITNEITQTLLAAAGVRFAVGTGDSQIKGVFANTDGYSVVESGETAALASEGFTNAYAALPQKFQPRAAWVMLPATFGAVLTFTYPGAGNTVPLVQFVNGEPTIMGKPVLLSDSAPAVEADSYSVFYGDLSAAYAVGIHRNITILRDPYTAKPYVSFYALARIGGTPMDNQAGVLIQTTDALVS